jgi:hypothetical protein
LDVIPPVGDLGKKIVVIYICPNSGENIMSKGERIYEINRRLAEITTYLNVLDELEKKGHSPLGEDPEKTAEEGANEVREIYNIRPELEAEHDELEKELASLLIKNSH